TGPTLPTRLLDTRNEALVGHTPKTDPANAKLAIDRSGPPAKAATHPNFDPVARPQLLLGSALLVRLYPRQVALEFNAFRRGGHGFPLSSRTDCQSVRFSSGRIDNPSYVFRPRGGLCLAERHAKKPQELSGFIIAVRAGHE